jgi:hypothetical protein
LVNRVRIGYPIVDGSAHDVDSNDLAFQIAGSLAFKDAVAKARPVLLEPIMAVECSTPPDYQGDVVGDLNRRRHGRRAARGDVRLRERDPLAVERPRQLACPASYTMIFAAD